MNHRALLLLGATILTLAAPGLASAQSATLAATPPGSAPAGSTISVRWTGPNATADFVTITKRGAEPTDYLDWKYTAAGSPASLVLPIEPGPYEIRYVLESPKRVLAALPYDVLAVDATIRAPQSAEAGSTITISWTGPNQAGDWLTIVEPSAGEKAYGSYVDADKDSRTLDLPVTPGAYEVRYVHGGVKVIARAPIEVEDVKADITAPVSVAPKAAFDISWKGPNNLGDWLTIVERSAGPTGYGSYVDVKPGTNTATLYAPELPGTYELRYVLGGTRVIGTSLINVGAAGPGSATREAIAAQAAANPKPRTIPLAGFAAAGTGTAVDPRSKGVPAEGGPAPRTIQLGGFAANGTGTGVASRPGEAVPGGTAAVPAPRTIMLVGFTATGVGSAAKPPVR